MMSNLRNCINWSSGNGISKCFTSFNFLSFTGSFFLVFQFVFFLFLNAVLVAWVIHLDMKEPVATFLEKVRGKTTYWSIKKERNKKKMLYCHLIEAAWAPRSRNCLLSISPSTRSSYFPSLSFYHFSISSHSNLCFPSVLVRLKLFPLQFTLFSFPHSPVHLDRCSGYSLHQCKRTVVRGL